MQTADIDEKSIRKETPEELVMALAEAKVCVRLDCACIVFLVHLILNK